MCKFLSAIVLRNGDVLCDPEHTDSHEDLLRSAHLRDDRVSTAAESFVRVEYVPPSTTDEIDNLDRWTIKVDQPSTPSWWDDCRPTVEQRLSACVNRMFVRGHKPLLLGGCWILLDGANVDTVQNARIVSMHGSARVGNMYDRSQVGGMYDRSQVGGLSDSSQVSDMYDESRVDRMNDRSQVVRMYGSSRVSRMNDRSQVGHMFDCSQVGRMYDRSRVDRTCGSSRVGRMCDESRVGRMYDRSRVDPSVQG